MIMFFLPWWTYVLIATIVFASALAGQWLGSIAFQKPTDDDGPYPCLAHVVTSNTVSWCWLEHGHGGEHVAMAQEWLMALAEWDGGPGEEIEPLPELPQRLSKVPGQPEHNDPWPLCGQDDCQRSKGHPGLCTG